MLNDSRKSLHFALFSNGENVIAGASNDDFFHVVNSELVGGQFAEMGICFYYSGSHSVTVDCWARSTDGSSTLLATATTGLWSAFKKVTTASNANYKLALGDKIYFTLTGIGSDLSTPVKGCSTYVTFK